MPDTDRNTELQSRPNRIPWPPLLLLGAIVLGWQLGRHVPTLQSLPMVDHYPLAAVQLWLGRLLIVLAIAMDLWVLALFRRHNTHIRPDRPARRLVTAGPFAVSRNPIYVGNLTIILGLALSNGSLWYLLLLPLMFLLLQELAIKREEAHMALLFGDAWRVYSGRVGRWL